jgi:hypothetical protein
MGLELQNAVVELVARLLGATQGETPDWLSHPARAEVGDRWKLIGGIYNGLTGLELPEEMPSKESRRADAVLLRRARPPLILEVDEKQHFNQFRATTLQHYPADLPLAFNRAEWLSRSTVKLELEGGGFARPCPPLFPGGGGRHRQRAFRDALCDILPPEHDWAPTLRIGHFEVEEWIHEPEAAVKMRALLEERLGL